MLNFKKPISKKSKIIIALAIVLAATVGIFGWRQFYALAQSVIDSFTDETKVADTWQTTVNTGVGEITLETKDCDEEAWFCALSTTCANTLGDGSYIIVKQGDAPTTKQWKTANTACDQPQCGIDGGQNGDQLKADNTLSFGTTYPAREYCKSIGGRLPTITELGCIWTNHASFGSFGTGYYWSGTEYSETGAWGVNFSTGVPGTSNKTYAYSVRCVRGW
ncbi:MAG TPA: hypothetical protein DCS28_02985 [Candidatus Moranbacteria bacterium]|nr:hypothetical protein [Candidatus Moranbacteria bacterium]HAT74977.1 hypothetical protein [Candidatus Moranbacteria bacterium]